MIAGSVWVTQPQHPLVTIAGGNENSRREEV
jgi:hypothetical protein